MASDSNEERFYQWRDLFSIPGLMLLALSPLIYLYLKAKESGGTETSFSNTGYPWIIGLIGAILIIAGLIIRIRNSNLIRRKNFPEYTRSIRMKFYAFILFLVLMVFISAYLLNPLVSPFGIIHDADRDWYADDADCYPYDPDFHHVPGTLIRMDSYDNLTNWIFQVIAVEGGITPTYEVYLTIYDANGSIILQNIQISGMIPDNYYNGVQFVDTDFIGAIDTNDYFIFKKSIFAQGSEFTLANSAGETYGIYTI